MLLLIFSYSCCLLFSHLNLFVLVPVLVLDLVLVLVFFLCSCSCSCVDLQILRVLQHKTDTAGKNQLSYASSGRIPSVRLLSLGSDVKNPFKEKNSIIYYIGLCSLRGLRSFQCPEIWLFYFLEISSYFMKKCLRSRSAISGNLKFWYLKKYPRADWAAVFSVSGNLAFYFFRSIHIFLWKMFAG